MAEPSLYAVSDLHVNHEENRAFVADRLYPQSPGDWLLVAGDVGDLMADVEWALSLLARRFARVVWAPGNHELWTPPTDPEQSRGQQRYERLVAMCRGQGILTPEDPYATWHGRGGPIVIAPLFLLYDYSFRAPGTRTKEESLARADEAGIMCSDEYLLDPQPFASVDAWCAFRLRHTLARLKEHQDGPRMVLVNHFPLNRRPTEMLRHPEFAQWCGTEATSDWHLRFPVEAAVYGHLHIPRTTWYDGVRFEEVSFGYPVERRGRPAGRPVLRRILPHES
ncbi:metallophosphoesterase family protein [Actinoplanes sp. NPDC049681]|uniref:metallophosphoesterase family protein n=1 Tax=Actinoplanes sp. NPDC049681 TaxID=3363905 RepID=UPI0037A0A940